MLRTLFSLFEDAVSDANPSPNPKPTPAAEVSEAPPAISTPKELDAFNQLLGVQGVHVKELILTWKQYADQIKMSADVDVQKEEKLGDLALCDRKESIRALNVKILNEFADAKGGIDDALLSRTERYMDNIVLQFEQLADLASHASDVAVQLAALGELCEVALSILDGMETQFTLYAEEIGYGFRAKNVSNEEVTQAVQAALIFSRLLSGKLLTPLDVNLASQYPKIFTNPNNLSDQALNPDANGEIGTMWKKISEDQDTFVVSYAGLFEPVKLEGKRTCDNHQFTITLT